MRDRPDEELIAECLQGNQDAWSTLIRRYRALIYAVIRSYRPADSDAADIFQSVCLELFHDLPDLRDAAAVRQWLITVSNRQCLRWKHAHRPVTPEGELIDPDSVADDQLPTAELFANIERAQILHDSLDQLPARCREMIRLLFLEPNRVPYAELARHLGVAVGSIGFIRRRCLDKLKRVLDKSGF